MILTIKDALENATSLPVKPFGTDTIEECICYKWYSVSDDGAIAQKRLELRLITFDMAEAEARRQQIINALVPIGDTCKIAGIYDCKLNGGGVEKE